LIGVSLYAPDVVVKELIQYQVEEVTDEMENMKKASQKLGHLLGQEPAKYEELKDFETNLENDKKKYLDSIGMKLVPTPKNIQIEMLIEMAVKKEAPFKKRGEDKAFPKEGFRDTIILFTIIEHMKDNQFRNAVLLSADSIFTKDAVTTRLKNDGLNLLVAKDLAEANGIMKKLINNALKSIVEEEKQTIKAFLVEHSNQIFDYVLKNAQVSESFLREFGGWSVMGSIEEVLTVRPKEIAEVSLGHTVSNETLPEGIEPITFSVSTEFDLLVREFGLSLLRFFNQPKFPLSAPENFPLTKLQYSPPGVEQRTVTREITVEATILEINGNYSDLQLLSVITY